MSEKEKMLCAAGPWIRPNEEKPPKDCDCFLAWVEDSVNMNPGIYTSRYICLLYWDDFIGFCDAFGGTFPVSKIIAWAKIRLPEDEK